MSTIPIVSHVILLPVHAQDPGESAASAQSAKERSMVKLIDLVNMAEVLYTNHVGKLAADGMGNARQLDPLEAVRNQTPQPALRPDQVLVNTMISQGSGAVINATA